MVSLATAGKVSKLLGLKKARIVVMDTKGKKLDDIEVLFNPSEYTMSKSISWLAALQKDRDRPGLEYKKSEVETLTMDLFLILMRLTRTSKLYR